MSKKVNLRNLGRVIKLLVVGSFVAAPSASGTTDREEALRHELAWMSVRDRLANVAMGDPISAQLRRIIEQEIEKSLEARVGYTYRAISPEDIAQLDALWMDHLLDRGANAEEIDRFLAARSGALRQLAKDKHESVDDPDQWRNIAREFSRSPYTG